MLTDHDDERGERSAAVARDTEELEEAANVVAPLPEEISLKLDLSVDIVEIASCKFREYICTQEIVSRNTPACNGVFLNFTNEA